MRYGLEVLKGLCAADCFEKSESVVADATYEFHLTNESWVADFDEAGHVWANWYETGNWMDHVVGGTCEKVRAAASGIVKGLGGSRANVYGGFQRLSRSGEVRGDLRSRRRRVESFIPRRSGEERCALEEISQGNLSSPSEKHF